MNEVRLKAAVKFAVCEINEWLNDFDEPNHLLSRIFSHRDCMWQRRSYKSLNAAFCVSFEWYYVSFLTSCSKILVYKLFKFARLISERACCKLSFFALSSLWYSTLVSKNLFPVREPTLVRSGRKAAELLGGWKFRKVSSGGGLAPKRVETTSSIRRERVVRIHKVI